MTTDSLFVLAVSVLTLGGVFLYLLRVEALAKKLESRLGDEELDAPFSASGAASPPLPSVEFSEPAPRELPVK